jgi:hypothetical protein
MQRPKGILKAMAILLFCIPPMWLMGLSFGAAFHEPMEIVNRTSTPISVTPVGVWHVSKVRDALPVTATRVVHWPALKNGDFVLPPGQSIRIIYDADDIDPTEIYVDAGPTRLYEVSVKQRSAADYDFDKDRRIEIADLSGLTPASAPVMTAAAGANRNEWAVLLTSLFLLGPLGIGAWLWILGRILEGEGKTPKDQSTPEKHVDDPLPLENPPNFCN